MGRLFLICAVGLLGGCGPNEVEAGQAVLSAAIPITFVGWLLQLGYLRLLGHIHRGASSSGKSLLFSWGAMLAVFVLSLVLRGSHNWEDWFLFAFVVVGTSYLTVLSLLMPLLLRTRGGKRYQLSFVLPWIVFGTPALCYAFLGSTTVEMDGLAVILWIYPGYMGLVAGPLLALAFCHAAYERHRFARRQRDDEPVFPSARVVKRR